MTRVESTRAALAVNLRVSMTLNLAPIIRMFVMSLGVLATASGAHAADFLVQPSGQATGDTCQS